MIKFNDFVSQYSDSTVEICDTFNKFLKSGSFIHGENCSNFEVEFSGYVGVKYCVGVGNAFDAIYAALCAFDIGEGDEVITTPLTAFATTLAILKAKATPVFVDVDQSGLLNLERISEAVTKKTKAVIPVNLYGQCINEKKLSNICKEYDIKLILDAAQCHGAESNGAQAGLYSDCAAWSFYPTKNLGGLGDGGALTTNDPNVASFVRKFCNYGQNQRYYHEYVGINSRLDELQAAMLRIFLTRLDHENMKRASIADRYFNQINAPGLELIRRAKASKGVFHLFPVLVDQREDFMNYMKRSKVTTLIHYPVLACDQKAIKPLNYRKTSSLEQAYKIANKVVSLPCHPSMTDQMVSSVIEAVNAYKQHS